jgi:nicotinamide-nucleotide amidase
MWRAQRGLSFGSGFAQDAGMKTGPGLRELMLRPPRLTLAVAESVTCGQVQARVGAISGASDFFPGGITAYTLDQKVRHLGVDRARAAAADCVSAEVAAQMARGAAALFGADLGVATTGYAEPDASRGVREPMAFWALAWRGADQAWITRTGKIICPGAARVAAQTMIADTTLAELLGHLRATRG